VAEYLGGNNIVIYADDSNVWVTANTWPEVKAGLEDISTRFEETACT
jgi:hypothetical protein